MYNFQHKYLFFYSILQGEEDGEGGIPSVQLKLPMSWTWGFNKYFHLNNKLWVRCPMKGEVLLIAALFSLTQGTRIDCFPQCQKDLQFKFNILFSPWVAEILNPLLLEIIQLNFPYFRKDLNHSRKSSPRCFYAFRGESREWINRYGINSSSILEILWSLVSETWLWIYLGHLLIMQSWTKITWITLILNLLTNIVRLVQLLARAL